MPHRPTRAEGRGSAEAVVSWQVQSAAVVGEDGAVISDPGYRADGWHIAPPRSTVMAALLAAGALPDLEYSTRPSRRRGPVLVRRSLVVPDGLLRDLATAIPP